jgi:hypothetical protein
MYLNIYALEFNNFMIYFPFGAKTHRRPCIRIIYFPATLLYSWLPAH